CRSLQTVIHLDGQRVAALRPVDDHADDTVRLRRAQKARSEIYRLFTHGSPHDAAAVADPTCHLYRRSPLRPSSAASPSSDITKRRLETRPPAAKGSSWRVSIN